MSYYKSLGFFDWFSSFQKCCSSKCSIKGYVLKYLVTAFFLCPDNFLEIWVTITAFLWKRTRSILLMSFSEWLSGDAFLSCWLFRDSKVSRFLNSQLHQMLQLGTMTLAMDSDLVWVVCRERCVRDSGSVVRTTAAMELGVSGKFHYICVVFL